MSADLLSFEVTDIERLQLPAMLEGFSLDAPTAKSKNSGHGLPFAGWVAARAPYQVPAVKVMDGTVMLKRVSVRQPRPDVSAYLRRPASADNRFGFHDPLGILGLPRNSRLHVVVEIYDPRDQSTRCAKVATIHGRPTSNLLTSSKYQPIMLTAMGRSGTTLMMKLLAEHRQILTSNFYPYEVKQAAYWMQVLKILSDPADFEGSSHPDKFENDLGFIGHNPYKHLESVRRYRTPSRFQDYFDKGLPRALADFSVSRIDEFYELIAADEDKPQAVYFAEKFSPTHLQSVVHQIYRSPKEIMLSRDFRDIICSVRSFNQKRNCQAFGRAAAQDDMEWLRRFFSQGARKVVEAWRDRRDAVLRVRYEDLILEPLTQMRRIFDYLQIEASERWLRRIEKDMFDSASSAHHRTSESPQKSIGRWKRDMPPEMIECCNQELSNELKAFGYE